MGEWTMIVDLVRRVPGWEQAEPTVTPMVGGITNRNFRVDVDAEPATRDELLAPGVLEAVSASIRCLHRSPPTCARFPILRVIERHASDAVASGGAVPAIYDELHTVARRIERALPADRPVPCHNDLLPANVLLATDRHWLIDFEY